MPHHGSEYMPLAFTSHFEFVKMLSIPEPPDSGAYS